MKKTISVSTLLILSICLSLWLLNRHIAYKQAELLIVESVHTQIWHCQHDTPDDLWLQDITDIEMAVAKLESIGCRDPYRTLEISGEKLAELKLSVYQRVSLYIANECDYGRFEELPKLVILYKKGVIKQNSFINEHQLRSWCQKTGQSYDKL